VTVACTPASGSTFPIGTTPVQCVAKDALERTGSCAFPVTVTAPPQLRRTRFMAFGDSITAGEVTVPVTGVTPAGQFPSFKLVQVPSASYPTVLTGLLQARYTTQIATTIVFNQGLGGEKAEFALPRFISSISSLGPDVVLLMEGYNDICCGNGSVGINAGARGLNDMAAEARNRRARVFIATLAPSKEGGSRSTPIEQVQAFNARVRSIVASEGAVLVDVYSALLPDVNANIGIDGLHPTELGYRRIADAFFAAIQADLEIR
jgi:lysophospholipase L1-like esterase